MKIAEAVLATLTYFDIFDYAPTFEQLHSFLIKKSSHNELKKTLQKMLASKRLYLSGEYYYLPRQTSSVKSTLKKSKFSNSKLKRAHLFANLLRAIPTISCVCLSGALAMNNSSKDDDIDLLVITSKKTLWTSRFLANLLLFPFKRSPNSPKKRDKACLNIFIDESDLKIKNRNIYTAHEVAQLKVLWGMKAYRKFISANNWISDYLPNWQTLKEVGSRSLYFPIPNFIEEFFKKIQLLYMAPKITIEKVSDTQVFFHPQDTEVSIIKAYKERLKKVKS